MSSSSLAIDPRAKKETEYEPSWAAINALDAEDVEAKGSTGSEKGEDQPESEREGPDALRVGAAAELSGRSEQVDAGGAG